MGFNSPPAFIADSVCQVIPECPLAVLDNPCHSLGRERMYKCTCQSWLKLVQAIVRSCSIICGHLFLDDVF